MVQPLAILSQIFNNFNVIFPNRSDLTSTKPANARCGTGSGKGKTEWNFVLPDTCRLSPYVGSEILVPFGRNHNQICSKLPKPIAKRLLRAVQSFKSTVARMSYFNSGSVVVQCNFICRSLRNMLAKLLWAVLQTDVAQSWTFPQFFSFIDDIRSRLVIHVFCIATCTHHRLYVMPTET